MTENNCMYCGSDLVGVKEIHVVEGMNFCCKDCAITAKAEGIIAGAWDEANEWYNEGAEIVTPEDIGIVHKNIWTVYSAEADLTFIMMSEYRDKDFNELKCTTVTGFYHGRPDDEATEEFMNKPTATYE